jgi:beta-lactamase superfamily II metal-dependent hydrolase
MFRHLPLVLLAFAGLAAAQPPKPDTPKLEIYWIDTEGNAATLLVTSTGQSLLIDSGSNDAEDRDAKRIFDVATKEAGLKKIDYLLTTHFAPDHEGGAAALAKLIPIEHFLDHGDSVDNQTPEGDKLFSTYRQLVAGKRRILKAGERLPLTGAQIDVVASNGAVLDHPLEGAAANPLCVKEKAKPADHTEEGRSVGILLTVGKFRYLNLGDLPWERELALACPIDNLGIVTLFDASSHGFDQSKSGAPAFVWAIDPQIVVINNAEHKGLNAQAWDTISRIPRVQGIWQQHVSLDQPDKLTAHNTRGLMIANTSATVHGFWLKASVSPAGNVSITNSRNGYTEVYAPR